MEQKARATPSPTSCRSTEGGARRKLELIAKTEAAVKDRLTKEITYWDHRAEQLKMQEQAGKPNAKLNSGEARKRADGLQAASKAPGGPEARSADLAAAARGARGPAGDPGGPARRDERTGTAHDRHARGHPGLSAARARAVVMDIERRLGFEPTTASSRSSATTSRAACRAPASCASSR
jgi:hypothetical protein